MIGWAQVLSLLVFVLAVGIGLYGWLRRRDLLVLTTEQQGWSHVEVDETLPRMWQGVPFGVGHHQTARNVVFGRHLGRQFASFEYRYRTLPGRAGHEESWWVVAVYLVRSLPSVQVTPRRRATELATAFGGVDIAVADPVFARDHVVRASDVTFAQAVLRPEVTRMLAGERIGAGWRIEGKTVLTWTRGTRYDLPDLEQRLRLLTTIAAALD